jgi:hypothetical protein
MARLILTANSTLYVRTDGSDANDGSANDAAHAFRTTNAAIFYAQRELDLSNFNLTLKHAMASPADSFPGIDGRSYVGEGALIIEGDTATPSNCVISATNSFGLQNVMFSQLYRIRGFRINVNTAGYGTIKASEGANIKFSAIEFGPTGHSHIMGTRLGKAVADGDYSIVGGGLNHYWGENGGLAMVVGRTVTLTGNPVFTQAFARCQKAGQIDVPANVYNGSTGASVKRYSAEQLGYINSNAAGPNYFPGNVAGTESDGGKYF